MLRALSATALLTLLVNAPDASQGTRVAYLDLARVAGETREGIALHKQLETLRKSRQAELDKSTNEVKDLRAELERQRLLLKPEALASRQKELEARTTALQGTYLRLQQDLSAEEAKAIRKVLGKTQTLAERIATREGLGLILEKRDAGIVWASRSLDLTNEVIRSYDAAGAP
jgi:outer membrane protein